MFETITLFPYGMESRGNWPNATASPTDVPLEMLVILLEVMLMAPVTVPPERANFDPICA
jgi:hypothetical protein